MADVTAAMVKQLRDATNVSMMECKRALVEADGDMDKASTLLRERGIAVAAKKATRTASQGLISSATSADGKTISLIEVNCETDFVAKNQTFVDFVQSLADKALETDASLGEELKDVMTEKITELGENIVLRRNERYILSGTGALASYIHMGGKVGVVIEVAAEKEETASNEQFQQLIKDLTLHVAASSPKYLTNAEMPADEIAAERDIFAKQVEDKPAEIVEKIVDGKMRKYCSEVCLVDQGFVKEPKQSITQLLEETGKAVDDTLTIKRFQRYTIGG